MNFQIANAVLAEFDLRRQNLLKRIITAVVCLAVFIPILLLSGEIPLLFSGVIALLALISAYEICGCVGVRKAVYISFPSYALVIASMALGICYMQQLHEMSFKTFALWMFAILFLYVFVVFASSMLSNGGTRFSQACETIAAVVYIIIGFISVLFTRYRDMGAYLLPLIFIGVWVTDSGAYFVGSLMGKHKLIPQVSPKKTVEGAVGGVLGCVLGYVIYALVLTFAFDVKVNYLYLIILAVVVAIIDQIGDLIASFMKREQGIKDFGNIFPGHGGVMDRFDSTLAVAPAILFVLQLASMTIFKL